MILCDLNYYAKEHCGKIILSMFVSLSLSSSEFFRSLKFFCGFGCFLFCRFLVDYLSILESFFLFYLLFNKLTNNSCLIKRSLYGMNLWLIIFSSKYFFLIFQPFWLYQNSRFCLHRILFTDFLIA